MPAKAKARPPPSRHLPARPRARLVQIWFKREDLAHTGAHKINNALGQGLLARRLGKKRIIAETGAGQHGVATATACAHLNLDCTVYMGAVDVQRQALNVFRMKMLGAKVVPVRSGSATLKDAINEALRDWVTNVDTTHYIIGSAIGPAPFPVLVKDLQSVIGREAREQILAQAGKLPSTVVACVGGGSNAIGMFAGFVDDEGVAIHGVEAGGHGVPGLVAISDAVAAGGSAVPGQATGEPTKHDGVEVAPHSATITAGRPGVLHGTRTMLLQDAAGQIIETHSISAGLDYPGVGPEHAHLAASGRVQYVAATDREALAALVTVSQTEGIIPALEPSHALHHAMKLAQTSHRDPADIILVNLCGRGDKDMQQVAEALGVDLTDGTRTQAVEVTAAAAAAADTGAAKRSALEVDAAATAAP